MSYLPGVCFPSHGREAVWTSSSAWPPATPLSNLSDIDSPRRIAARPDGASVSIDFALPGARSIDFLCIVGHSAGAAATFDLSLSSGTDPAAGDLFAQSGLPFWPTPRLEASYIFSRPLLLDAPVMARSGRITLSANPAPWEISAVEIGRFWAWPDLAQDRDFGIDSRSALQDMILGAQRATRQWGARAASGTRSVISAAEADTTVMDFQRFFGRSRAFVWSGNVADPESWPRMTWLARNESLPPTQEFDYEAAKMRFDFVEHLK